MTDWNLVAKEVRRNMQDKQPEIKIRDVAKWFDLASTSSAEYYLNKLKEMGVVKWIAGKWFLAW